MLHSGSHFHHGLLQLMIHTIDPLSEGGSQSKEKENIECRTKLSEKARKRSVKATL